MSEHRIIPTAERYVEGFHRAVDVVARERAYLALIEAPPLENSRAFVEGMLAGAGVQMLVVDAEDTVVGFCDVVRDTRAGFTHRGTLGMGLLPHARGRGLGKRLMAETIAAARAAGIERIELEVFASNVRARALYDSLGFVTEGLKRRSRKLDGVYDDDIFMALVFE
ncbi:MAG: GNAT family N-acetyltransferase [Gemmatimonadota bacterium]|nr:GNAT family N-acetyltransferase [Gemmatimonadota bacterium]